jgi:hypothetical protein
LIRLFILLRCSGFNCRHVVPQKKSLHTRSVIS